MEVQKERDNSLIFWLKDRVSMNDKIPKITFSSRTCQFLILMFYIQVANGLIPDQRIRELSYGPSKVARVYPAFIVNGYRFHTRQYGQNKSTTNSGVCVKGSTYNENECDYYGIIEEILELSYLGDDNHTFLFKCHWFDPNSVRYDTAYEIVDIKHKSKLSTYDPFILAAQAQQVYYTKYPSSTNKERNDWWAVCKVKTRLFPEYELDRTETNELDINPEFFQADLVRDANLATSSVVDAETFSLSIENEVEEIDPEDNELQLEDSDEEIHTSEEDESDNEDSNAEFDISPTSEDENW